MKISMMSASPKSAVAASLLPGMLAAAAVARYSGGLVVQGAGKAPEPRSIRVGGKGRFQVDGRAAAGRRD